MLYEKYLKTLKKCPFCELDKGEILKQNKFAVLTLAKAPYTKNHLLVLPKRHVFKLSNLPQEQKDDFEKLVYWGMKKLHKKHANISIVYREGSKKGVGKSISHLHYHLIPNMKIGSHDINWRKRKIYSEKEYVKMVKSMKKKFTKA
jgi:diadenosine tetraphosphate (Ap4A) HIT family hydrolase